MPYGIGGFSAFNGLGCCDKNGPDDVAYAKAIVTYLEDNGCTQKYNAFQTGFSNGGFMGHKIGCEGGLRSDGEPWFRAIAPHSGLIGSYDKTPYNCKPSQNVPIMAFHGAQDKTVPISGQNPNPFNSAVWTSWQATMDQWAVANKCVGSPTKTQVTSTTDCTKYSNGCSVEFCLASGLDHNWMGSENSQDYDATGAILKFFKANLKK